MPRRGDRRKIAKNCYEDKTGRSIIYRNRAGRQLEIRFPPDTPIAAMREEVDYRLSQDSSTGTVTVRGTLDGAIEELAAIEGAIKGWVERRAELRAWSKAGIDGARLGTFRVRAITEAVCRRVLNEWLHAGVAPKTVRQRRWTLQHLYRVLYGKRIRTPVDDIPPPPKTKTIPVPIDPAHVL